MRWYSRLVNEWDMVAYLRWTREGERALGDAPGDAPRVSPPGSGPAPGFRPRPPGSEDSTRGSIPKTSLQPRHSLEPLGVARIKPRVESSAPAGSARRRDPPSR